MTETDDTSVKPARTMLGKTLGGLAREPESNIKMLEEYERFVKLTESQKKRLQMLLKQEDSNARMNRMKIFNKWRTYMRIAKADELSKDIDILSQDHVRQVDRMDNLIHSLMIDITALNQQFNVAQRSQMGRMDEFQTIHDHRMHALENEFEYNLAIIKSEFNTERATLMNNHKVETKELKALLEEIESVEQAKALEQRQAHETECEEIKNKNLDTINVLKVTLETQIDDLERQFDEAHQNYIENTQERTKEFKELKEKDKTLSEAIDDALKKISKLQMTLSYWKKKMGQNTRECDERNTTLRNEKAATSRHYRELKNRMNKFRESQAKKLTELTQYSRTSLKSNQEKLVMAEKIIRLFERCRLLETEIEKVKPFYNTESDISDPNDEIPLKEDALMSNFYKKFNKVLLDQVALDIQKNKLTKENGDLKAVLTQYLEGVQVQADTIDDPMNALLIINRSRHVENPMMTKITATIEGNSELKKYEMAQRKYPIS